MKYISILKRMVQNSDHLVQNSDHLVQNSHRSVEKLEAIVRRIEQSIAYYQRQARSVDPGFRQSITIAQQQVWSDSCRSIAHDWEPILALGVSWTITPFGAVSFVNDLKRVELIGHMFRSSEIRHQAVFAFMLRWDAVEIQVELPRLPSISMAAYWNPSQCQKFERT